MKKSVPILVVGILVLSGLGAVATPSKKQIVNTLQKTAQPEIEIDIKGRLFLVKVAITNTGDETIEVRTCTITIDAVIMLRGRKTVFNPCCSSWKLQPGDTDTVRSKFVLGFGLATINVAVTAIGVTENKEVTGFIWGPLILIR